MAQETETLLFEVILDIPKVKENSEIALAALNRLRAEKEKTQKLFESKLLGEAVYKKTMQALQVEIDKTETELAGYTKTLSEHAQRQQAAEKTVAGLTAGLAALNPQVDTLATGQDKAAKSTDELNDHITILSNQFKNEQAVAKAMAGSMDEVDKVLTDLEDQYRKLTPAQRENAQIGGLLLKQVNELTDVQQKNQKVVDDSKKGIKDYIRDMNVLGINVGSTIDSFKSGQQGVLAFAKGIFSARGALVALTAVPIIAVLAAVIAFFRSTDEGADKLEQGLGFLTAAFDSLVKGIAPVGKLLVDLFTSPIETIKKLVKGTDEYKVSLTGVASAAIRAGTAQAEYIKTMQDVEDAENALIVQRAQVGLQVDQALLKVKDRSLSEKQRIDILNQAGKAEADLATKTQKNAQDTYDAAVKLNKEKLAANKKLTDDEQLLEDKAHAALIDAQRDSLNTQQTIQNRRSALLEQDAADQKERAAKAEERAKKLAADKVAEAETALLQAKKNGESTIQIEEAILQRQIELIHARAEAEKVGKDVSDSQKKQIDAQAQADELEAIKAHARLVEERTLAIQENQIAAKLALVRKGTQAEYDLQQKALTARLDREKSAAADSIHNDKERTAELRRLDALYNADSEALAQQFEQNQVQQEADHAEQVLQIRQNAGGLSLADQRKIAADRIKLEEQTQLALLEIEKKYALKQTSPNDNDAREKVEKDFATKRQGVLSKTSALLGGLERDANAEAINNAKARAETSLALSKAGSQAELEARIDMIHAQRMAELNNANLTADERVAINAKANRAIGDAEDEFLKKQIGQVLDVYSKATSVAADFINTQIGNQQKALDDQQEAALGSAALNAEARASIEADYQKKKAKLEKEAAKERKNIAMVETLINTAKAVVEAAPNPFLMALAGAVGALQLGIISSQQFALGGVSQAPQGPVFGPSHAQGGIQMYHKSGAHLGEMEGKEIILTKGVYEDPVLRAKASALNVAGGGISFANLPIGPTYRPSIPLRMAMGGVARYYQQQSTTASIDYARMEQIMIRAIGSLPPPEVQVKTIRSAINQEVRVENRVNK